MRAILWWGSVRGLFVVVILPLLYLQTVSSTPTKTTTNTDGDSTIQCTPTSKSLVKCTLQNVVKDRPVFNIDVLVNQCHDPVDMTFYLNSLDYKWNFTYVPNNQNERVYLPDIFLNEPAHMAPTYLYVREPQDEFNRRNGSTSNTSITVLASIVAVYKSMWEEEEFLNYTYVLPDGRNKICPSYSSNTKRKFPDWILKMIILATVPPLAVAFISLVAFKYKDALKRTIRLDNLNLMRNADQPATTTQNPGSNSNNTSNGQGTPQTGSNNNEELKNGTKTNGISTNPTQQNSVIASSLKKLKQNIEVSIKTNLPFQKLKEDQDSRNSLEFTKVVREGGSVTTSNPSYLSKSDSQPQPTFTTCQNGSKNNLYWDQTDSTTGPKYPAAGNQREEINNGAKNSKKSQFEYGSRDYLDQLESSSAVNYSQTSDDKTLPVEKREWEQKFDESEEENENKITFAKCKVKKKVIPKEEDTPAKHTVKDALQKGYFSYEVNE